MDQSFQTYHVHVLVNNFWRAACRVIAPDESDALRQAKAFLPHTLAALPLRLESDDDSKASRRHPLD